MFPRLVLAPLLLTCACTTVELRERQAFDAKRTVSTDLLQRLGVTREAGRLEVEPGVELSTWHLRKPGAQGTVLYFGGNGYLMVNAHDILLGVADGPVDVFTFDYRGYGESDGEPSVAATKRDALAVYDHLIGARGVDPDRLVLHGQSLGSFVAAYVADQRPVAGVVLETPVTNVEDLLGHLAPWWTRALIRFDVDPALASEDNLERVADLRVPLLLIAGEEDPIAHPDMARALLEAAGSRDKQLAVLDGGSHNDLPPRADYRSHRARFLSRVLPATTADAGRSPAEPATALSSSR